MNHFFPLLVLSLSSSSSELELIALAKLVPLIFFKLSLPHSLTYVALITSPACRSFIIVHYTLSFYHVTKRCILAIEKGRRTFWFQIQMMHHSDFCQDGS
mmetsp:Transcript_25841/g.38703  ORF Transcript_25841/g.38703 Transcript_25841/m.38703 type:complete len:100 (-) Transcript_25841:195-494(-)